MFTVNVKLAGAEGVQSLFYETEKEALFASDAILAAVDQHTVKWTTDAKGHTLGVIPRNVISVYVTDLKKDLENQADLMLMQARANTAFQSKMSADPAMRFMQGVQGMNLSGLQRQ